MATRKTATKVSRKATIDVDVDEKQSRKTNRKVKKTIKKMKPVAILCVVLFLCVGACAGFFATKILTKNDCFVLLGEENVTRIVSQDNETGLTEAELADRQYVDEGVKVISFGKDLKDKVKIETNMDYNNGVFTSKELGTFYIKYTVESVKYGSIVKIQKIRLVSFVEPSEDIVTE